MNTSFSNKNPLIQIAWDNTSLNLFKTCPKKYYYSIIVGRQSPDESVHLTFGILYHEAHRHFQRLLLEGVSREDAIKRTVRLLLKWTWDEAKQRPTLIEDPYKNRLTLIRSFIWHCDKYIDDNLETMILPDNRPALEISFRFLSAHKTYSTSENYIICGHMDRVVKTSGIYLIQDYKTTKYNVDSSDFFSFYSPDNQVSTYAFGGRVVYELPTQGVMIDAAQVQVGGTRFRRSPIQRSEAQLTEWYNELAYWLSTAESCALNNYWPMNETACGMYGGCPFRAVCGKDPSTRDIWLRPFRTREWDPLKIRGEI